MDNNNFFVLWIIMWTVVVIMMFSAESESREWHGDIEIEYNSSGAIIEDSQVEPMIEYAAWALTERAQKETRYIGQTSSDGDKRSGKVTVRWVSPDEMAEIGDNRFHVGYTQSWWYLDDGRMAGAIIHLNRSANLSGGECLSHTITHEVLHAVGYAGHSDDPHDVMYANQQHCRSALTVDDVRGLPYGESMCWTELTQGRDLYIPFVDGKAAFLSYTGDNRWKLDQWADSAGDCSTVTLTGAQKAILSDVRGKGEQYYAEFVPAEGNKWRLYYAE